MEDRRLVVISNRLPVVLSREKQGWSAVPGSGGLVTALAPVLKDRQGTWIGWTGTASEDIPDQGSLEEAVKRSGETAGYDLVPLALNEQDVELYYGGMSNSVLWPLFHDLLSRCDFDPKFWETYQKVNRVFAEKAGAHSGVDDFVWVQDYQLLLMGKAMEQAGIHRQKGFFLHIPFPPPDIFTKLPWRRQVLDAMLHYQLLGFQTRRDRRNFLDCVARMLPDHRILGRGKVRVVATEERLVRVGAFPISIDYQDFAGRAASKEVAEAAWLIHENFPGIKLILGVDRLDYTKGIPHRLKALADALERHPELRRKVTLVQVVVPSRTHVSEYQDLRKEIERLVSWVNGRFADVGWLPIHYIYRSLSPTELLGFYRTCEVSLITPLKDGMNLVAKEYCASNIEETGALVLSEFAGAADELNKLAILVNPYDIQGVADAINQAVHMPESERRQRMSAARRQIQRHNVYGWVSDFLRAADRRPRPPADEA